MQHQDDYATPNANRTNNLMYTSSADQNSNLNPLHIFTQPNVLSPPIASLKIQCKKRNIPYQLHGQQSDLQQLILQSTSSGKPMMIVIETPRSTSATQISHVFSDRYSFPKLSGSQANVVKIVTYPSLMLNANYGTTKDKKQIANIYQQHVGGSVGTGNLGYVTAGTGTNGYSNMNGAQNYSRSSLRNMSSTSPRIKLRNIHSSNKNIAFEHSPDSKRSLKSSKNATIFQKLLVYEENLKGGASSTTSIPISSTNPEFRTLAESLSTNYNIPNVQPAYKLSDIKQSTSTLKPKNKLLLLIDQANLRNIQNYISRSRLSKHVELMVFGQLVQPSKSLIAKNVFFASDDGRQILKELGKIGFGRMDECTDRYIQLSTSRKNRQLSILQSMEGGAENNQSRHQNGGVRNSVNVGAFGYSDSAGRSPLQGVDNNANNANLGYNNNINNSPSLQASSHSDSHPKQFDRNQMAKVSQRSRQSIMSNASSNAARFNRTWVIDINRQNPDQYIMYEQSKQQLQGLSRNMSAVSKNASRIISNRYSKSSESQMESIRHNNLNEDFKFNSGSKNNSNAINVNSNIENQNAGGNGGLFSSGNNGSANNAAGIVAGGAAAVGAAAGTKKILKLTKASKKQPQAPQSEQILQQSHYVERNPNQVSNSSVNSNPVNNAGFYRNNKYQQNPSNVIQQTSDEYRNSARESIMHMDDPFYHNMSTPKQSIANERSGQGFVKRDKRQSLAGGEQTGEFGYGGGGLPLSSPAGSQIRRIGSQTNITQPQLIIDGLTGELFPGQENALKQRLDVSNRNGDNTSLSNNDAGRMSFNSSSNNNIINNISVHSKPTPTENLVIDGMTGELFPGQQTLLKKRGSLSITTEEKGWASAAVDRAKSGTTSSISGIGVNALGYTAANNNSNGVSNKSIPESRHYSISSSPNPISSNKPKLIDGLTGELIGGVQYPRRDSMPVNLAQQQQLNKEKPPKKSSHYPGIVTTTPAQSTRSVSDHNSTGNNYGYTVNNANPTNGGEQSKRQQDNLLDVPIRQRLLTNTIFNKLTKLTASTPTTNTTTLSPDPAVRTPVYQTIKHSPNIKPQIIHQLPESTRSIDDSSNGNSRITGVNVASTSGQGNRTNDNKQSGISIAAVVPPSPSTSSPRYTTTTNNNNQYYGYNNTTRPNITTTTTSHYTSSNDHNSNLSKDPSTSPKYKIYTAEEYNSKLRNEGKEVTPTSTYTSSSPYSTNNYNKQQYNTTAYTRDYKPPVYASMSNTATSNAYGYNNSSSNSPSKNHYTYDRNMYVSSPEPETNVVVSNSTTVNAPAAVYNYDSRNSRNSSSRKQVISSPYSHPRDEYSSYNSYNNYEERHKRNQRIVPAATQQQPNSQYKTHLSLQDEDPFHQKRSSFTKSGLKRGSYMDRKEDGKRDPFSPYNENGSRIHLGDRQNDNSRSKRGSSIGRTSMQVKDYATPAVTTTYNDTRMVTSPVREIRVDNNGVIPSSRYNSNNNYDFDNDYEKTVNSNGVTVYKKRTTNSAEKGSRRASSIENSPHQHHNNNSRNLYTTTTTSRSPTVTNTYEYTTTTRDPVAVSTRNNRHIVDDGTGNVKRYEPSNRQNAYSPVRNNRDSGYTVQRNSSSYGNGDNPLRRISARQTVLTTAATTQDEPVSIQRTYQRVERQYHSPTHHVYERRESQQPRVQASFFNIDNRPQRKYDGNEYGLPPRPSRRQRGSQLMMSAGAEVGVSSWAGANGQKEQQHAPTTLDNISDIRQKASEIFELSDDSIIRRNNIRFGIVNRYSNNSYNSDKISQTQTHQQLLQLRNQEIPVDSVKSQLNPLQESNTLPSLIHKVITSQKSLRKQKQAYAHISTAANSFHFLIDQDLGYVKQWIRRYVLTKNDSIETFRGVEEMYEAMQEQGVVYRRKQCDVGLVFVKKVETGDHLPLRQSVRVKDNYFFVSIQPISSRNRSNSTTEADVSTQPLLQIIQSRNQIKLSHLSHLKLTQKILIEPLLMHIILYQQSESGNSFQHDQLLFTQYVKNLLNLFPQNCQFVKSAYKAPLTVQRIDKLVRQMNGGGFQNNRQNLQFQLQQIPQASSLSSFQSPQLCRVYIICDQRQMMNATFQLDRLKRKDFSVMGVSIPAQICRVICIPSDNNILDNESKIEEYPNVAWMTNTSQIQDYRSLIKYAFSQEQDNNVRGWDRGNSQQRERISYTANDRPIQNHENRYSLQTPAPAPFTTPVTETIFYHSRHKNLEYQLERDFPSRFNYKAFTYIDEVYGMLPSNTQGNSNSSGKNILILHPCLSDQQHLGLLKVFDKIYMLGKTENIQRKVVRVSNTMELIELLKD